MPILLGLLTVVGFISRPRELEDMRFGACLPLVANRYG